MLRNREQWKDGDINILNIPTEWWVWGTKVNEVNRRRWWESSITFNMATALCYSSYSLFVVANCLIFWVFFFLRWLQNSSVQFSRSVISDLLRPHELQHPRLPCPTPTPGVHSNSCSLNWWCRPTIPSFVVPLSSHLQSFPASGSFKWVSSSH